MKINQRVILIVALTVLLGFRRGGESTRAESHKPQKPALAVVLCDVSGTVSRAKTSQTSTSLSSVIDHANKLVLNYYPTKSTVLFLPISNVRHAEILEEISLKSGSAARKKKEMEDRKAGLERLTKKLTALSRAASATTCILTSIENAYDIFRVKAQDKKYAPDQLTYELVILSDMIEDCRDSPVGDVKLQKNSDGPQRQIEKLVSQVALNSPSIRVKIVVTTQFISSEFDQKIQRFWRTAFRKMQYRDVDQLIFAPLL